MSEYKTIRMVSGSWPPEICGVGDFMDRLSTAVVDGGLDARRIRLSRWSVFTALSLLVSSHARRHELVYMSYPTEGYGKSVLPFALAFGSRKRVVLHLHEYSSKNRYARALLRLFRSLETIYFSNSNDRDRYIDDCGLAGTPRLMRTLARIADAVQHSGLYANRGSRRTPIACHAFRANQAAEGP